MISCGLNLSSKSSRIVYVVSLYFQAYPIAAALYLCHLGDLWPLSFHYYAEEAEVPWDVRRRLLADSARQTQDTGESPLLVLVDAVGVPSEASAGPGPLAVDSPLR